MGKRTWNNSIWIVLIYGLGIQGLFGQTETIAPSGLRVAWDYSSLQQLAPQGGYPRVVRLNSGQLLVVYEDYQGDIQLKSSMDAGKSLSGPQTVFQSFHVKGESAGERVQIRMSNPELMELNDGRLLLACNYRPTRDGVAPFSIALRVSDDSAETWSSPEVLYQAGKDFKDGCWVPSFLQMPSGEVQLFFANESPYRDSHEQEISVIRSLDNGQNWQKPTRVSFREGKRDGMPVAVASDEHIYLAIEDNKVGEFKPYIIRSPMANSWQKSVSGEDSDRWYALDSLQADSVYMGAPYLLGLPGGQYLLSYQTNKNRSGDWEKSTMEVRVAGPGARGFSRTTRPFPIPSTGEGKWNSLSLLSEGKVAALSSVKFGQEKVAPWMIEGYLLPDVIDLADPQDSAYLFVGSRSENRLQTWINRVDEKIEMRTKLTAEAGDEFQSAQGFCVYFSGNIEQAFRLRVEKPNEIHWEALQANGWVEQQAPNGAAATWQENRNELVLRLPFEDSEQGWIGLSLDYKTRDAVAKEEPLVHMDPSDPQTWILLKF